MSEDLRYPVGKFQFEGPISDAQRGKLIDEIEQAPKHLRAAVQGLNTQQFETAYRPDGWTVRQVVHHVADSHMNAFIRFKLALTEDHPTIKPYMEDRWAKLDDVLVDPEVSLTLLDNLHVRFVRVLRSIKPEGWQRTFQHPELGKVSLDRNLALYAWHGRHHTAHITGLRQRMGWD